jgi:hypothetical protein
MPIARNLAAFIFSAFFALLHQPSGRPIYVNAEQIDYIGPADKWLDGPDAGSRVMVYGIWVAVREKPSEVKTEVDRVLKQDATP